MNRGVPKWLLHKTKTIYVHPNPLDDEESFGLLLKNAYLVESMSDPSIKRLVFDLRYTQLWNTDKNGNAVDINKLDFKRLRPGSSVAVKQNNLVKEDQFQLYVLANKQSVTNPLEYQMDENASYLEFNLIGVSE